MMDKVINMSITHQSASSWNKATEFDLTHLKQTKPKIQPTGKLG